MDSSSYTSIMEGCYFIVIVFAIACLVIGILLGYFIPHFWHWFIPYLHRITA